MARDRPLAGRPSPSPSPSQNGERGPGAAGIRLRVAPPTSATTAPSAPLSPDTAPPPAATTPSDSLSPDTAPPPVATSPSDSLSPVCGDRVGGGGLCPPQPGRGGVWGPFEGPHHDDGRGEGAPAPGEAAALSTSPHLLRLLQIASPALPVGAFAHSQGLEYAVEAGWVRDEASAAAWIHGLLATSLAALEVPALARLHAAWSAGDAAGVRAVNDFVYAARGSRELQDEDRRLGGALARALVTLEVPTAAGWTGGDARACYVTLFALAASHWRIPPADAAAALLYAWCENQAAAAMRLVPLGQSAGLRICDRALALIPALVQAGLALDDDDMGATAPGAALASALHETQYSRIFRS
jgi:urease accessory protein